jgi:predicted kinase
LLFDYEAEVSIQYLEAPAEELHRRNQARAAPVPAGALQRMLERWEIPLASEAHEVVYCWGSAGDEVGS